jgi:pyruvate ferredoxin oxidoreductase delta subunit
MSDSKKLGWKEIPEGGLIIKAGNSATYETGSWRSARPVRDVDKCTNCLICWVYCPDSSILTSDGKLTGIDYSHCKGCGICAEECPVKAIKMVDEKEFIRQKGGKNE